MRQDSRRTECPVIPAFTHCALFYGKEGEERRTKEAMEDLPSSSQSLTRSHSLIVYTAAQHSTAQHSTAQHSTAVAGGGGGVDAPSQSLTHSLTRSQTHKLHTHNVD
mgnify:CR=1 FL=1